MAIKAAPQATKLAKADRNNQFWISKPRPFGEIDYRPAFGSTVELFSVPTIATEIQTYPLIEAIPPNTTLVFPAGSVTTLVGAKKDDTVIKVVSGATALTTAGEKAPVIGTEQTVVLAADVKVGDRYIDVVGLSDWIEANREITFTTSGVKVRTVKRENAGATRIFVEPVKVGTVAVGTTVIISGDAAALPNYELVASANSVNRTQNGQTLTDYVFASGGDALKDVTTRDRNFAVSGKFVPFDFGLERVEQAIDAGSTYMHFISSEGKLGGYTWSAEGVISSNSDTNAVNQFKDTQFTMEVNGAIERMSYPILVSY